MGIMVGTDGPAVLRTEDAEVLNTDDWTMQGDSSRCGITHANNCRSRRADGTYVLRTTARTARRYLEQERLVHIKKSRYVRADRRDVRVR